MLHLRHDSALDKNRCRSRLCQTASVAEAPVRTSKNGLVTDGEGWFVVNARESRWREEGPLGAYCTFEGKGRFPHFGINISVLEPGETMGMYHHENGQEAFLVLAGECTLIVEGEERPLQTWDFFIARRGPNTSSSRPVSNLQLSWQSEPADEASAGESSTRSARLRLGTERVLLAKPRNRQPPTRRFARDFRGRSGSSTGQAGSLVLNYAPTPSPRTTATYAASTCLSGRQCSATGRLRRPPAEMFEECYAVGSTREAASFGVRFPENLAAGSTHLSVPPAARIPNSESDSAM